MGYELRVSPRRFSSGKSEPLDAFGRDIVARFPTIENRPGAPNIVVIENEAPFQVYRTPDGIIVDIAWDAITQVAPVIVDLAWARALLVHEMYRGINLEPPDRSSLLEAWKEIETTETAATDAIAERWRPDEPTGVIEGVTTEEATDKERETGWHEFWIWADRSVETASEAESMVAGLQLGAVDLAADRRVPDLVQETLQAWGVGHQGSQGHGSVLAEQGPGWARLFVRTNDLDYVAVVLTGAAALSGLWCFDRTAGILFPSGNGDAADKP